MSSELFEQKMLELRKNVKELNEAMDKLRLYVKYLMFDLEATRRENASLRKLLDELSDFETGEF